VFSFSLERGVFTVGGYDTQRFGLGKDPRLEWFPLANNNTSSSASSGDQGEGSHWAIAMPALKVNGSTYQLESRVAILDTGTSHIRVPANDFDRLKTLIEQRPG